jgi:hypothetical protein
MSDRPARPYPGLPPYLQALADHAAEHAHLPGFDRIHSEFSELADHVKRRGVVFASQEPAKPDHSMRIVLSPGADWIKCPVNGCPGMVPK